MRLLHNRHDHVRSRPAAKDSDSDAPGDRPRHGGQRLPLLHLSAHHQGHRAGGERRCEMNTDFEIELERYEFNEGLPYRFEPDRREFFKLAGAGIAVFLVAADALAQPPGRRPGGMGGGGRPQEVGAWLHVGEDGKVTAFSGKVELGQNIRTSLSQVVAEELRVPLASVVMVLADTDRTPFDMGTFGSRTTPDMAVQMRRAAAAARDWLIDLAAEQNGAKRGALAAADGKVIDKTANRSWTFGELTKGKKLTKTISADVKVTPAGEWKVEGTS